MNIQPRCGPGLQEALELCLDRIVTGSDWTRDLQLKILGLLVAHGADITHSKFVNKVVCS